MRSVDHPLQLDIGLDHVGQAVDVNGSTTLYKLSTIINDLKKKNLLRPAYLIA